MKNLPVVSAFLFALLTAGCVSFVFESDPGAEPWTAQSKIVWNGAAGTTAFVLYKNTDSGRHTLAYKTTIGAWVFRVCPPLFDTAVPAGADTSSGYPYFVLEEAGGKKTLAVFDIFSGWEQLPCHPGSENEKLLFMDASKRYVQFLYQDKRNGRLRYAILSGAERQWVTVEYDPAVVSGTPLAFTAGENLPFLLMRDTAGAVPYVVWYRGYGEWVKNPCAPLVDGSRLLAFRAAEDFPVLIYQNARTGFLAAAAGAGETDWDDIDRPPSALDSDFLDADVEKTAPYLLLRHRPAGALVVAAYSPQTAAWTETKTIDLQKDFSVAGFSASGGVPTVFLKDTGAALLRVFSHYDGQWHAFDFP